MRTVQRAQGLPIAIVEEIAYEERLGHARPAHGVRGTLWQEPVRAAYQRHSRRQDHARAESEELTRVDSQWVVRLPSFFNVPVMACMRVIRATGT